MTGYQYIPLHLSKNVWQTSTDKSYCLLEERPCILTISMVGQGISISSMIHRTRLIRLTANLVDSEITDGHRTAIGRPPSIGIDRTVTLIHSQLAELSSEATRLLHKRNLDILNRVTNLKNQTAGLEDANKRLQEQNRVLFDALQRLEQDFKCKALLVSSFYSSIS